MQPISRITAVVLLLAMAAVLPGAHRLAFSNTSQTHPAGCHHEQPAPASPASSDYQCCANGHNWAIAGSSFAIRPLIAVLPGLEGVPQISANSVVLKPSAIAITSSTGPPGLAPLRI